MAEESKTPKFEQFIVRFYKVAGFFLIILLIGSFISDVFRTRYYIEDMEATIFTESLSLSEAEMHKRLKDEMDLVYKFARSIKGLHPKISTVANPFSVDIGGVSTSYFTLVDFVKYKLKFENNGIAGTIYGDADQYCYRTRIGQFLVDHETMTFDSTYDNLDIFNAILRKQAIGIIEHNDPYIAAMYHFKNGEFDKSIELAKKSLNEEPDARQFALGTIANALRESHNYEESEEYYLKSMEEFPQFYPTYWQYGRLLVLMERFEEAEKHFHLTLENDNSLQKPTMRSLLELYCHQNRSDDFSAMKERYLNDGKIEELVNDTLLSICL
jgi:tetratricopeptide (TPR) repeat protein